MSTSRIAVIDDSLAVRPGLQLVCDTRGYTVVFHPRAAGAVAFVKQQQPDLVIVDVHLEYPNAGLDVVRSLRAGCGNGVDPAGGVSWRHGHGAHGGAPGPGRHRADTQKYAGLPPLLAAVARLTAAAGGNPAA